MNGPARLNGDRNAIVRSAFRAGLGQRKLGGIVGPDGQELNAGNPYRVAVVLVSQGAMVHADFALSFASLCFNPGALIALVGHKVEPGLGNLSMGYNNAIEAARPLNVDYYFFVSPDIVLPQFALRQLLSRQRDVVGAAYMRASAEQGLIVAPLDDQPIQEGEPVAEVRAIPPGCMLVKASVLGALKRPYFRAGVVEEDIEYGVMPAIVPEWIGFCDQARAIGLKVYMDVELSTHTARAGEAIFRLPTPPPEPPVSGPIIPSAATSPAETEAHERASA